MRRERNQYIFASELTRRNRSHRFRNAVLLLLPILIGALWVLNITVSRRVRLEEIRLTVLNLPAILLPIAFRPMDMNRQPLQAESKAASPLKPAPRVIPAW